MRREREILGGLEEKTEKEREREGEKEREGTVVSRDRNHEIS
jgi:hypothetical protein